MAKEEKEKKKKSNLKKNTKKKDKKKKGPKESYFKKVSKELKLVKWPEAKEVVKYTISTIIMCLVLCGVFMLLNALLAVIKESF